MIEAFISYARDDEAAVELVISDLQRARAQVSRNTASADRQPLWTTVLDAIRRCTVFVPALSDQAMGCEHCRVELTYARSLGVPILPVQVGDLVRYRSEPAVESPLVDYRQSSRSTAIDLISALHDRANDRGELPDPLPPAPPIPAEYLDRLAAAVYGEADLASTEQRLILGELRTAVDKDEPSRRAEVHRLLRALRARQDVTFQIAVEIDSILAAAGSSGRAHTAQAVADVFGDEREYRVAPTVAAAGTPMYKRAAPAGAAPSPARQENARSGAGIDDLLESAVAAINRGDRETASALVDQVLAVDDGNTDAEDLLAAPVGTGEIRRLTILFADLVDSTVLSTQVEPETYRLLVGRYREQVLRIVERYEGHVGSTKGDGLLVVFGYPTAHENDVHRAVQAGLEITRDVTRLSEQAERRFGLHVNVRVGIHRGVVYLDTTQDDVYGLAANLAARVSGLAPPGTVVVSDAVERLIESDFDVQALTPAPVKGVDELINHYRVIGERQIANRLPLGPVVGRDRELARIEKSWTRAQSGTLSTPGVVFRGEAGIGKSRLAAAAIDLVEGDGGVVLELVGSPFHPETGLHPVRALLERRCGINRHTQAPQRLDLLRGEIEARALDVDVLVPLLAPVLGIAPEHGYRPVAAEGRKLQELISDAVQTYLRACFGGGPGLLVAEDAHWFDPSTLELLGQILSETTDRLLVVITGRDGNWLDPHWPVKLFDLKPLNDEQTDELVEALHPDATPEERAAVRRRCDGVPFYIEQVVAGLGAAAGDGDRPPVPDPLYEPLFARLLTTPNVVPVLEAGAVIGRRVDRGLLLTVTSLAEDDVDDAIDELESARVIEPDAADGFVFRHELLREVAAEMAPPSVRRGLHAKVADALVEGAAGEPDWRLVAAHYQHAERHVEAASAYQKASADARLRGALNEARTYLGHAIDQLAQCPPGVSRDRLEITPRLVRGFLASAAEGYQSPAVAADFERCLQLVGTDIRDDEVVATLVALCSYYVPRADLRHASQLLELVNAGIGDDRKWFRPAMQSAFGMVAFLRGDFRAARGYFEEATSGLVDDEARRIEALWFIPDDPIALAHEHLAMDHLFNGDVARAEVEFGRAIGRAERLDFPRGPYNHVYAIDIEIWMRTEAGQFDEARTLVADMVERAERYGFDFWQLFGATEQALIDATELLTGDDPPADALAGQIAAVTGFVDLWRSLGLYAYQTHYDCLLAQLLTAAGRRDDARARIETALAIARDTEMHMYDAELLRARARTQADPAAGEQDLAAAVDLARHQGAPLFQLRAAIDDFSARGEPARAGLADAADRFPTDSVVPEFARAQWLLHPASDTR